MSSSTTEQVTPATTEKLSVKAWLYIVAGIGAGALLGMELGSAPWKAQAKDWQDLASDWKKQAGEYKAKSEQDAVHATRWELEANRALALAARCATPSTEAN